MNRSILIVICDFLLISLLAFSTVDINKMAAPNAQRVARLELATNRVDSASENGKDLAAVMRLALEEERKTRERLTGQLSEREQQMQAYQQQLQAREREERQLQQTQANLQQQFAAAQTNLQTLTQQLQSTSAESLLSREKLAAMQDEMRKQAEQAAALQAQLSQLARSNAVVTSERQQLANQLQVAETEKRAAVEKVSFMTDQVKVEREEKAKLAEGVKALASKSSELTQEIRENRSLAPNEIFSDFVTNRVAARFDATRPSVFGESNKKREAQTVLVSNGTNIYALCHVHDTPLVLINPGTDWDQLTGSLSHDATQLPLQKMIFSLRDPRILFLPVDPHQARQLGCKIYHIASDPYKFQDAVLVGTREGYYGECRFEIDLNTPGYVKLDRSFIKGLFGKFNPSSGDLVLSRTGELLGVMANGSYCMMLQNFDGAAELRLGQNSKEQHTGVILSQMYAMVSEMPYRLQ